MLFARCDLDCFIRDRKPLQLPARRRAPGGLQQNVTFIRYQAPRLPPMKQLVDFEVPPARIDLGSDYGRINLARTSHGTCWPCAINHSLNQKLRGNLWISRPAYVKHTYKTMGTIY